jgi:hypothetical protein
MTDHPSIAAFGKLIDMAIAFALTMFISLVFGMAVDFELAGASKAWFFFWLLIGFPFRAIQDSVITIPISLGLLLIFVVCLRIGNRKLRLLALTMWFLLWEFYGAMCLSIISGGA